STALHSTLFTCKRNGKNFGITFVSQRDLKEHRFAARWNLTPMPRLKPQIPITRLMSTTSYSLLT
ncbi:unnamed protein product, partial [Allacma fusca]